MPTNEDLLLAALLLRKVSQRGTIYGAHRLQAGDLADRIEREIDQEARREVSDCDTTEEQDDV